MTLGASDRELPSLGAPGEGTMVMSTIEGHWSECVVFTVVGYTTRIDVDGVTHVGLKCERVLDEDRAVMMVLGEDEYKRIG